MRASVDIMAVSVNMGTVWSGGAKAAEGRRTPKRWRDCHGPCVREASWSAPSPLALFPVNHPNANGNVIGYNFPDNRLHPNDPRTAGWLLFPGRLFFPSQNHQTDQNTGGGDGAAGRKVAVNGQGAV